MSALDPLAELMGRVIEFAAPVLERRRMRKEREREQLRNAPSGKTRND
ncbi:hypothetical protein ACQKOH_11720 [Sphingomonas sp. NPDC092331]|jgi:hypothetical protein|nr:hypothetical protein [Pseudomonadota bacterium]